MTELIQVKSSSIDRQGVFAVAAIAEGTRIVEYSGKKITYLDSLECKDTTYHYQVDMDYVIEGESAARYVNHSCDPNCDSEVIEGAVWIFAIRDICVGEELTFNYGYGLEEALKNKCRCRAQNCAGFIAHPTLWPHLPQN